MSARRVAIAAAAVLGAALLGAGCAPPRVEVQELPVAGLEGVFRQALRQREALGKAMDEEVTIRVRVTGWYPIPTANGYVAISAPDRVRLRISSSFGTALDCAAHGDSIVAYLPGSRAASAADAARDPVGIRFPGTLGVRVLGALWRPADSAWEAARAKPGSRALVWAQRGESLRVTLDAEGRPSSVRIAASDSVRIRIRYLAWLRHDGVAWPSLLELEDEGGAVRVRCTVDAARFRDTIEPGRLTVRMPAEIELVPWPKFRRALIEAGKVES